MTIIIISVNIFYLILDISQYLNNMAKGAVRARHDSPLKSDRVASLLLRPHTTYARLM